MNHILTYSSIARGPFSAVRPHQGEKEITPGPPAPRPVVPQDSFDTSDDTGVEPSSASPSDRALRDQASKSGLSVALGAFPQVVQLLVDPGESWGENLSKRVGLPLISLNDGDVTDLATELKKEQYANGFILEGFPKDTSTAEALESLLGNVSEAGRRVVGWELTSESHQDVLDHYINLDLLWMLPEAPGEPSVNSPEDSLMSCLQGLPALHR